MPSFFLSRDVVEAVAASADADVHQDAPAGVISLSWAFLFVPCILLILVFIWLVYNFSQPSEFPEANGFSHADCDVDDTNQPDDEKQQLLDAFHESQSHSVRSPPLSPALTNDSASGSAWKISAKFSTTARGGSNYTSYPDPNGVYPISPKSPFDPPSPKAARSPPRSETRHSRAVGSKAAKIFALNRERMMNDLESLDPADRAELTRSSSRASDARKSD